jgi:hypothetical protein
MWPVMTAAIDASTGMMAQIKTTPAMPQISDATASGLVGRDAAAGDPALG